MRLLDDSSRFNRYKTMTGNRIASGNSASIYVAYRTMVKKVTEEIEGYLFGAIYNAKSFNAENYVSDLERKLDAYKSISDYDKIKDLPIRQKFFIIFGKTIEVYFNIKAF